MFRYQPSRRGSEAASANVDVQGTRANHCCDCSFELEVRDLAIPRDRSYPLTVKVKCELLHTRRFADRWIGIPVQSCATAKTAGTIRPCLGVLTTQVQSLSGRWWTAKRSKPSRPRGIPMSIQMVLLPVFVQVGLTFALLLWRRNASGARDALQTESFLDELGVPMLFYVLIAIAQPLRHADLVIVMLSWVFVVTRFAHAGMLVTAKGGRQRSWPGSPACWCCWRCGSISR